MPKGSDEGLHGKVHIAYGKVPHPAYKRHQKLPLGFTLVHYAGEVVYDMAGFLEKNKVSHTSHGHRGEARLHTCLPPTASLWHGHRERHRHRGEARLHICLPLTAPFLESCMPQDRGPVDALPLLRSSSCGLIRTAFAPTKAEQARALHPSRQPYSLPYYPPPLPYYPPPPTLPLPSYA